MEKKKDNRLHRIKVDYGSNDYYRFFRRNNPSINLDRSTYGFILKEFNGHVRDRLSLKGAEYIFPNKIGKMELRKIKTEVIVGDNGKIINKLPINWRDTRILWDSNPVAKEKRLKVRYDNEHTDGFTFRILFIKSKANFKNKSIYKMKFNRIMKRNLSRSIFDGRIDAFLRD